MMQSVPSILDTDTNPDCTDCHHSQALSAQRIRYIYILFSVPASFSAGFASGLGIGLVFTCFDLGLSCFFGARLSFPSLPELLPSQSESRLHEKTKTIIVLVGRLKALEQQLSYSKVKCSHSQ